jgi:hypothetical protein
MNCELVRMWKVAIVAYFKALSWHSPRVRNTRSHRENTRSTRCCCTSVLTEEMNEVYYVFVVCLTTLSIAHTI